MRGLGRHIWGETSSSSCTGWGKETIGNMVTPPRQGSLGTRSHASLEKMNKTRGNISKLIQARETLEKRDRVLTASIRRCHVELAKRKCLSEIEASKDAVEAAWNEFNHATARFCMHAGGDLSQKELDEQPEEARRAWYEWKALSNMMEQVVDEAEEYLESATKENSWGELCEDEDGGNELDAEVEVRLWVEQLSIMNKVNEEFAVNYAVNNAVDNAKMNEVAPEVSTVDEVNEDEVNVDEVNVDEVNMDEVNMGEVNVDEVNVNEVNEESAMIEDSGEVCGVKEEMSKGKSLEIEAKVEVKEESEEVVTAKPPDVLLRFDSTATVQVEEFGMKEVMQIDYLKMKKESRHASWDPGEPVNAKAQTEMLDAKEEKILVNNGKVGLKGDVNWMVFHAAMELNIIVLFNIKEMLVVFSLSRFVNGFRLDCRIELSDYG